MLVATSPSLMQGSDPPRKALPEGPQTLLFHVFRNSATLSPAPSLLTSPFLARPRHSRPGPAPPHLGPALFGPVPPGPSPAPLRSRSAAFPTLPQGVKSRRVGRGLLRKPSAPGWEKGRGLSGALGTMRPLRSAGSFPEAEARGAGQGRSGVRGG